MVKGRPANVSDVDLKTDMQAAVNDAFALLSDSQMAITMGHNQFHSNSGNSFEVSHEFSNVASGGTRYVTIVAATDKTPHITSIEWQPTSQNVRAEVFRAPTIDTQGGSADAVANLLDGGAAPASTLRVNDTTTSDGTLIKRIGSAGGREAGSSSQTTGNERQLQNGETYIFKLTNVGNGSMDYLWFDAFWYEI